MLSAAALVSRPVVAAQATAAPKTTPTPSADDHHTRGAQDVFRVKPLGGNVYALYGRGGNVAFFVGPDAILVVDSQYKELAPGIVAEIRKVSDKPIKFLVNTHHHLDHVGGNEVFKQFAMIIAHDNVRKRMLASPADVLRDFPAILESAKKSGDEQTSQDCLGADRVGQDRQGRGHPRAHHDVRLGAAHPHGRRDDPGLASAAAHTDCDSVVYFEKAKVLHAGDDGFNRVIPVIDIKSGGSVKGYLPALDKIVARVPADAPWSSRDTAR